MCVVPIVGLLSGAVIYVSFFKCPWRQHGLMCFTDIELVLHSPD